MDAEAAAAAADLEVEAAAEVVDLEAVVVAAAAAAEDGGRTSRHPHPTSLHRSLLAIPLLWHKKYSPSSQFFSPSSDISRNRHFCQRFPYCQVLFTIFP